MKRMATLLAAAAGVFFGSSAEATLLVSSSFDYALSDGASLPTVDDTEGIGFDGSWSGGAFSATGLSSSTVGGATGGAGFFSGGTVSRPIVDPGLTGAFTTYFSILVDPNATATGIRVLFQSQNSTSNGYGLHMNVNDSDPANPGGESVTIWPRAGAGHSASFSVDGWEPFTIIGKFVANDTTGGGTTTLWVNPTDVSGADPVATLTASFEQASAITYTNGATVRPNNSSIYIDELRLGTSLGDVTAVPEPTSLGVLALGGAALIGRRRKA